MLRFLYPACASGIIVVITVISQATWQRFTQQSISLSFNVGNLLHVNVLLNALMTDANQRQPSPTRAGGPHRFLSAMHGHMWYGDLFTPLGFTNPPLVCTARTFVALRGAELRRLLHQLCGSSVR